MYCRIEICVCVYIMKTKQFQVDDLVLVHHGVMIFEAKILKIDDALAENNQPTQYFVHYQGWNKKWDEWVAQDRVLEDNKAGRLLQQQAKEQNSKKGKRKGGGNQTVRTATNANGSGKKIITAGGVVVDKKKKNNANPFKLIKIDKHQELEDLMSKNTVALPMPLKLKKQLVDEWKVTTGLKLRYMKKIVC